MKRTYLGEFEERVLLTVAVLDGKAYGVAVTHEIIEQTDRQVRLNHVHAALLRLEEKGMVASILEEATQERGAGESVFLPVLPSENKPYSISNPCVPSSGASCPRLLTASLGL